LARKELEVLEINMQHKQFKTLDQLVTARRNSLLKNMKPKKIATAVGFLSLWAGLLTAVVLVRSEQDLRQQASTGNTVQLKLYSAEHPSTTWTDTARNINPGKKLSIKVESRPDQLKVSAVDLVLRYNPEHFTAPEVTVLEPTFGVLLKKEVDERTGKIRVAVGRNPERELVGIQPVVQVLLTATSKVGASQITLDPQETKVAALNFPTNVYVGGTEPLSVTVANPSDQTPTTKLQFKFKYAGAPVENNAAFFKDAIKAQKVKVSLQNLATGEIIPAPLAATALTIDQTAAKKHFFTLAQPWSSTALPAGTYQILVKGPMHQQIRYCKDQQSADHRCAPREGFAITPGANLTLDFSARPLACGDLPISGSKSDRQDGSVRVTDYSFMLNCLGKRSDAACVARADCNGDGVITNLDMDLLLNTLSTAYDE
jgi:hypothetical protein